MPARAGSSRSRRWCQQPALPGGASGSPPNFTSRSISSPPIRSVAPYYRDCEVRMFPLVRLVLVPVGFLVLAVGAAWAAPAGTVVGLSGDCTVEHSGARGAAAL